MHEALLTIDNRLFFFLCLQNLIVTMLLMSDDGKTSNSTLISTLFTMHDLLMSNKYLLFYILNAIATQSSPF